jgi:hypothetical protein
MSTQMDSDLPFIAIDTLKVTNGDAKKWFTHMCAAHKITRNVQVYFFKEFPALAKLNL